MGILAQIGTWLETSSSTLSGPSISFLFGLIALILGALYNARLTRRRDDRLRDIEAKAIAAALYGEILQLRVSIADVANVVGRTYIDQGTKRNPTSRFDATFQERATLTQPVIYPSLAAKLGMLPPEIVLSVTQFHAKYQEVKSWIPRLVDNDERGFTYSVLSLLQPAKEAVTDIKPTLAKIERWLGIAVAAPDPLMPNALEALDLEKDFWQSEGH